MFKEPQVVIMKKKVLLKFQWHIGLIIQLVATNTPINIKTHVVTFLILKKMVTFLILKKMFTQSLDSVHKCKMWNEGMHAAINVMFMLCFQKMA